MGQWEVPGFLQEKLKGQYGQELAGRILEGYRQERPVTLRANTLKADAASVRKRLEEAGILCQEVPWSREALVITNAREPELQKLELYGEGGIYLQSLSSMLPPLVLGPKAGESILDMAAAPGGKTTQMAALSGNMASITACEKNQIRAKRLQYNLDRQGASRVCVMVADARKLDDFFSFDKVLLDAPCTGSGTLDICRKGGKGQLDGDILRRSAKVQEELLAKALKHLKPGHEMVYSTCSVLAEENEQVVKKAMKKAGAKVLPINTGQFPGIFLLPTELEGTMCVCPDGLYEGFFVARLQKP
ncbi:RsmB/NOP family class I SAM-dependent RNA methyltransferase [Clostridiaceae bacterium]|nr:RsmB/NOP family class I SAM-dependent RNA methyltransferase [Clostridiaceae bacterium]RKI18091.1 RsmB/NOP family class I SAM-dependent RNA methyltransferase [bacterium 1XD21-70]